MGQVEEHWGSEWTDHKEIPGTFDPSSGYAQEALRRLAYTLMPAPYKVEPVAEPGYPTKPDKSWRPDDWKTEEIKNHPLHCLNPQHCADYFFEAGTTAMLEAIWKLAKDSPTGCFTFDTREINQYNERVKRW
jgi:hypothetical protein